MSKLILFLLLLISFTASAGVVTDTNGKVSDLTEVAAAPASFDTLGIADPFAEIEAKVAATPGFNIFGIHLSGYTLSLLIGIFGEIILRWIPSGKYASFLGILHWLDNVLPSKDKP